MVDAGAGGGPKGPQGPSSKQNQFEQALTDDAFDSVDQLGLDPHDHEALFACAWAGEAWHLDAGVIQVWIGATLVELIGVVLVVTQYLFPKRDRGPVDR